MKLTLQKALITSVVNRGENHGDEIVPAQSIGFEVQCALGVLKQFNPGLKAMLFTEDSIPRVIDIGAIEWLAEYEKASLVLEFGVEDLAFADVELKGIKITPEPSGVVTIRGRINVETNNEKARGKLAGLVKQEVKITLEKLTQKTIEEAEEEEEDDGQGSIPGLGADGQPIVGLQH